MTDPAAPYSILDRLDALERLVRGLSRAPTLSQSAIKGGRVRVFDSADRVILVIGDLDAGGIGTEFYADTGQIVGRFGSIDAGARDGFQLFAGGIEVIRGDERGALSPNVYVPAYQVQDVAVNSPTYTTTHVSRVPMMKNPYFHFEVSVDCAVGTTGSMRLTIFRTPGGTQTSAVKSIPDGALATYHLYIQVNMALNGRAEFSLETKRDSGTGTIRISTPFIDTGDYSATATTGGVWA